jgi:hypothetical protein
MGRIFEEATEQEAPRCRHSTPVGPERGEHTLDRAQLRVI